MTVGITPRKQPVEFLENDGDRRIGGGFMGLNLPQVRGIMDCRKPEILDGPGQAVGARLAMADAEYL